MRAHARHPTCPRAPVAYWGKWCISNRSATDQREGLP